MRNAVCVESKTGFRLREFAHHFQISFKFFLQIIETTLVRLYAVYVSA